MLFNVGSIALLMVLLVAMVGVGGLLSVGSSTQSATGSAVLTPANPQGCVTVVTAFGKKTVCPPQPTPITPAEMCNTAETALGIIKVCSSAVSAGILAQLSNVMIDAVDKIVAERRFNVTNATTPKPITEPKPVCVTIKTVLGRKTICR